MYSVQNGSEVEFNEETGAISVTATSSNMYVNLDSSKMLKQGKDYQYIKLGLSSSNAADFRILPSPEGEGHNWSAAGMTFQLDSYRTDYVYLSLSDKTVHDFESSNLTLYASTTGHNITIVSVEYVNEAEKAADDYLLSTIYNPENYDSRKEGYNGGKYSLMVRGWEWAFTGVQKLLDDGYGTLTFDFTVAGANVGALNIGGTVYQPGRVELNLKDYASGIYFSPKTASGGVPSGAGYICYHNAELTLAPEEPEVPEKTPEEIEAELIAKFYTEEAWDKGTYMADQCEAGVSIAMRGWEMQISATYLQELYAAGFRSISFKLGNIGWPSDPDGYNGTYAEDSTFTTTLTADMGGLWFQGNGPVDTILLASEFTATK